VFSIEGQIMSSLEIRRIMESLERIVNEDPSSIDGMIRDYKMDAIGIAKQIQANNYYFSDSDEMSFWDDHGELGDILSAIQEFEQFLRFIPVVDDGEATIKTKIDRLASMG
jgi:hypothetical protein